MSDVPTLKQEVERKAIEALEMVAIDKDMEKITEAQYGYALAVLWTACAGIAGSDFTIMMEVAQKAKKNHSSHTKVYLRNARGDLARVINLHDGSVQFILNMNDGTLHSKTFDFTGEPGAYVKAKEKFQATIDTMMVKGFEEI